MEINRKHFTLLMVVCGLFLSVIICGGVSASNVTTSNHIITVNGSKSITSTVTTKTVVSQSKSTVKNASSTKSSGLPSYYDLRKLGKLTPVKDQGFSGVCWAFAVTGSLESNLLPYQSWNFSENNLKNLLSSSYQYGFDRGYDDAGCWQEALAYLTRYSGPVNASQDPFHEFSGSSPTNLKAVKHVQNTVQIMSRTITGKMNNTALKEAIMKYGAVYSLMTYEDSSYNPNTFGYYYTGNIDYNHAIDIVGWDDNYSKNNFIGGAPGNGAFIVRNSWGASWGDKGYFYVSYYDKYLANTDDNIVFMDAESVKNYDNVYQYDPFGDVGNYGYDDDIGWFSNVFKSNGRELLKAASFYVTEPNTAYNIYVYLNPVGNNPRSGVLAAVKSGFIDTAGYKTILLNNFVSLMKNEKFSIVVKLVSPNTFQPITIEYPLIDYSSKARASPGQSFVSSNGNSWDDMTWIIDNANVCLKAFTSNLGADLGITVKSSNKNPRSNSVVYYYVTVQNYGPEQSFNVAVNSLISTKLNFISYITNIGSFDPNTGKWVIGNLPAGSVVTLILKYGVAEVNSITNRFVVSSSTYDYNLLNNAANMTIDTDKNITSQNNDVDNGYWTKSKNNEQSNSIPMKNTGLPIIPLIVGILLVTAGTVIKKR